MDSGKVVEIIGAVVDVLFSRQSIPKVYDALRIKENNLTLEVQQQIGDGIVRTIELKPTGFPQLTANDVVKYKFLMTYGTPKEFKDGFHHYQNDKTDLKVRELDKSHVQIQMNSLALDEKLRVAIDDMYSPEGIEYQKKLLLRAIDF